MNKRPNIFFFPAWYPHRGDAMFGLFVKRHAEAVSKFANVSVVFAIGENRGEGATFDTEIKNEEGIKTIRIYFKKSTLKFIGSLINGYRYISSMKKGYDMLTAEVGKPDINHVHVLTRGGLFPLWKKITNGIPFIITEHWSRYLPINEGAYSGFIHKWITEIIVKRAFSVTPVSPRLAEAMQQHGLKNNNYTLINNVVDTDTFVPVEHHQACLKWIHVSCFDEHPKNITGLLKGFAEAHKINPKLHLTLVGNGIDWDSSKSFASSIHLGRDAVTFTGLLQGNDLRDAFQRHDAFVMFSRFENQPVVIIEAFACGLPVVATSVGSIPEMLADSRGITVSSEDTHALSQAIQTMADGEFEFSREAIRQYAVEHFSMHTVGKRFYELYLSAIENKHS